MLCARGPLDNNEASQNCFANAVGVRPNPNDASSTSAATAWLDANCFVTGHEKDHRAATPEGLLRVRLVTDSVPPQTVPR